MRSLLKWTGLGCGCLSLIVAGVLVLVVVASMMSNRQGGTTTVSSSPPASGAAPTAVPRLGDTVTSGNWSYRVTNVERKKSFTWLGTATKDAKGEWVLVQIALTNIGRQSYPIHSWDFEVHDSDGVVYKPDAFASTSYSSALKLADLNGDFPPGVETASGLAVDINPSAKALKLKLTQTGAFISLEQ